MNLTRAQMFSLLLCFVMFTSCAGQVSKNVPENSVPTPKTVAVAHPKLIRTQGSTEYDNVHCGVQERAGNLWFGTTGEGVYRYDGKLFTQFTTQDGLSSNAVWSILEDKGGVIWLGTDAGICRYDGKTFVALPITITKGSSFTSTADELPPAKNAVWSMLQDKNGKIWLGTSAGVFCYAGGKFTQFLHDDGVHNPAGLHLKMIQSMIQDRQGNIWFASGLGGGEGVCKFDGQSILNFKPVGDQNVRSLVEDPKGNVWIFMQGNAVFCIGASAPFPEASADGGKGGSLHNYAQDAALQEASGNSMVIDKAGHIWLGMDYVDDVLRDTVGGVWRFSPEAAIQAGSISATHFTTLDGLPNTSVFCVVEDRAGNHWFGTRNTGLCRYDGKVIERFSE